jgi:hypothetical protein
MGVISVDFFIRSYQLGHVVAKHEQQALYTEVKKFRSRGC